MTHGCMGISGTVWRHHAGTSCHWARMAALSVVVVLAFASSTLAGSPPDSAAYALAAGDRIALTVVGQPDLSGEMTIDGSGNIVLPWIGAIRVEDLTVPGCQQLIRERLADGVLKQPVVSVRISELRPLYVLGDVRAPGAYPFRYGSTVKIAVALAGGFRTLPQSAAMWEYLLADERVQQLTFENAALRIRQARLEAQRDGKETFSPPDLPPSMHQKKVADLVANEQATLASATAILKAQIELLNGQKPRLKQEADAINGQIAAGQKRLDFVTNEQKRSGELVKQGLGVHAAEVQLKLEEGNQVNNLWQLAAQVSRLQTYIGDLDIKIQEAEASFKKQILTELQTARGRLAEVSVTLPSAREIRDLKLEQAEGAAEIEVARSFNITRSRHGEVLVLEGSETTSLEPGDVVDIRKVLPGLRTRTPAG